MTEIPESYLGQLRDAGLLCSEPFVPGHVAFPDGVIVAKPSTVPGNGRPARVMNWGNDGATVDASLYLHSADGRWVVTSHDYVPGPGPGDFVNEWATPQEAIADILDFFFGDPVRMDIKQQAHDELIGRGTGT